MLPVPFAALVAGLGWMGRTALAAVLTFLFVAPKSLALSPHNCQVIYRSLPAAKTPAQFTMMKTLLTGFYLERGNEELIKGVGDNRYYFSSDLIARALKVPAGPQPRKSALIFSLKELEQIAPGAYPGTHFIFAGSFSELPAGSSHGQFAYLSQRFASNGWTLSFLLGKSWQGQLRSAKVMLLRRIAKITGGRGLTFFKKDVASCLVSLRPNPDYPHAEPGQGDMPTPISNDGKARKGRSIEVPQDSAIGQRLQEALDDPNIRKL